MSQSVKQYAFEESCFQSNIAFLCLICLYIQNITKINDIVKQALLVFPHFCLGRGLMDMAKNQAMANLYKNLGKALTQTEACSSVLKADICGTVSELFVFRWRPLWKSSQLEHGGQESVCHVHSGGSYVRPDPPHTVQVFLQINVRNTLSLHV